MAFGCTSVGIFIVTLFWFSQVALAQPCTSRFYSLPSARTKGGDPIYTFFITANPQSADAYCKKKGLAKAGAVRSLSRLDIAKTMGLSNVQAAVDAETGAVCMRPDCQIITGVECLRSGQAPCTPDGAGNIGRLNVGNNNFGVGNVGAYNIGNFNQGDKNIGNRNKGASGVGCNNKGNSLLGKGVKGNGIKLSAQVLLTCPSVVAATIRVNDLLPTQDRDCPYTPVIGTCQVRDGFTIAGKNIRIVTGITKGASQCCDLCYETTGCCGFVFEAMGELGPVCMLKNSFNLVKAPGPFTAAGGRCIPTFK